MRLAMYTTINRLALNLVPAPSHGSQRTCTCDIDICIASTILDACIPDLGPVRQGHCWLSTILVAILRNGELGLYALLV